MSKNLKSITACFLLLLGSGIRLLGQEIPYEVCDHCWNPDSLGNHRAVIDVTSQAPVIKADIPWRRHDKNIQNKNIIFTDSRGTKITNVRRISVNEETGRFAFESISGPGQYYCYYLPYQSKGRSNYPSIKYPPYKESHDSAWLRNINSANAVDAKIVAFQSIDEWNSFYPMEVIATKKEIGEIEAMYPGKKYFVFPEDRLHPVKMPQLPSRWKSGPSAAFAGSASRGENFSYQLAVYSTQQSLENVRIRFSDLVSASGSQIPAHAISCLMTDGIAYDGNPFTKIVDVPQNTVQTMWCLVNIPSTVPASIYSGTATVTIKGLEPTTVNIKITVDDKRLNDHGTDEPWKQTRLAWLNSTLAANDEVIAPFTPLAVSDNTISLLGRSITLAPTGFPQRITSYFTPEMTSIGAKGTEVLASPIDFIAEGVAGSYRWKADGMHITRNSDGRATWNARSQYGGLQLSVEGQIEFDGYIHYVVELRALEDVGLKDVRMVMPFKEGSSKYMMGLGQTGGYRPDTLNWKWDVARKNQDGAWIGAVNAGIQFSLRDEKYVRPLNTNFYLQKPLMLPSSWGNGDKGGINIEKKNGQVAVSAYSGARAMKKGELLYYNFTLLITPFHTLDTDFQWKTRFYHKYSPIDTVIARGSTVINIHHATEINPYINYPFLRTAQMKAYIDEAHRKGLKVKIYNTVRELSNRAWETFPMRSLGTEIYSPGKGGGWSWLQEHIGENYIAAWFVPELQDAAIINSGMSRWHNYYVEGMDWLVRNVGIDGIYLDDVAFDRVTMKRIRRVLQSERGPGIIDLHSANQYNKNDGFNNSANLYMEHFPYLNRLWFGEYFDYDKSPDFWLTEVSGIPFGLMGEMLEKGGNKWRGMLYGITNRMPYDGNDPSAIWKAWDSFGIQQSEMIGYWVENPPVKTDHPDVLATVYKRKDAILVAIASWAKEDVTVQLKIDWEQLGMTPILKMEIPAIHDYQTGQIVTSGQSLTIPKGKGLLVILR